MTTTMNRIYKKFCESNRRIGFSAIIFQRMCLSNLAFVPRCDPAKEEDVLKVRDFINSYDKMCVVTGAGVSTESGIPDYRSAGVGLYARSSRRPVLYKDFCGSDAIRRRYWARNYVGWPRFSSLKPNSTHEWLKKLEDEGNVTCVVTQNVDNLHIKAGSRNVIELHGTAFRVMCLGCDHKISRYTLQNIFDELNPNMNAESQMIRPDGDVDLSQEQVEGFVVPPCENCGGVLKPDIVFFGDNVPQAIVQDVKRNVEQADALLVLGTTLSTYSGYRIALQARDARKPIAVVNIGGTRADDIVDLKIYGRCGEILPKISDMHGTTDYSES